MNSLDIEDIHPAKKMKLEENFPDPQDGTNNENLEHPEQEYIVLVELNEIRHNRSSGGDTLSLFRKIMRDAGCPESKIDPIYTSLNFFAKLTPEEVKRLSGLDFVHIVTPTISRRCIHG